MFRSATIRLATRISDLLDDMLVGDFEYVVHAAKLYADVDYFREHPHHEPKLTWTPAAGRSFGPQRTAIAGPKARRPGGAPAPVAVCVSDMSASGRPVTAAGRARAPH